MADNPADDRRFMLRALSLARRGVGRASPNPSVGCVLVRAGKVVGQGFHEYAAHDHAEVRAIREAGTLSRGATAFVTLEPCSHHGRTPPCTTLLIESGIRRVVAPMADPNPRVAGAGFEALRMAGVRADVGLLENDAKRLVEPFACFINSGRPLVVAKAGMSLDGKIATCRGETRWITSGDGRKLGQELRLRLDAILVGIGTVLADDPQLTYRGRSPKSRPLLRVILDGRLRTPPSARVFRGGAAGPVLIFCRNDAPRGRRSPLERCGAEIIAVPHDRHGLKLEPVMDELGRREITGLLVEGGSSVHWSFVAAELIDKFYFLIAPMILGGLRAAPSVGGAGFPTIASAARFKFLRTFQAGCDLVLESYPSYSRSIMSPWRV